MARGGKPPYWSGQVWYTQQDGFVIRHENIGEAYHLAKDSDEDLFQRVVDNEKGGEKA